MPAKMSDLPKEIQNILLCHKMDYYGILGLSGPKDSKEKIKKAYDDLVKKAFEALDNNTKKLEESDESSIQAQKLKEIQEAIVQAQKLIQTAYDDLSVPKKKNLYDVKYNEKKDEWELIHTLRTAISIDDDALTYHEPSLFSESYNGHIDIKLKNGSDAIKLRLLFGSSCHSIGSNVLYLAFSSFKYALDFVKENIFKIMPQAVKPEILKETVTTEAKIAEARKQAKASGTAPSTEVPFLEDTLPTTSKFVEQTAVTLSFRPQILHNIEYHLDTFHNSKDPIVRYNSLLGMSDAIERALDPNSRDYEIQNMETDRKIGIANLKTQVDELKEKYEKTLKTKETFTKDPRKKLLDFEKAENLPLPHNVEYEIRHFETNQTSKEIKTLSEQFYNAPDQLSRYAVILQIDGLIKRTCVGSKISPSYRNGLTKFHEIYITPLLNKYKETLGIDPSNIKGIYGSESVVPQKTGTEEEQPKKAAP